eukprot:g8088.t1
MSGAATRTFYKRTLPSPPAIAFSSTEGIELFREALENGTALSFFKLSEQYSTQAEPAFCGLASISIVLNALSIDPRRTWKAPWRWFDETLLDCCKPLEKVKEEGLSLPQAACLAKCNGASVTLYQFGTFSLETFREHVIKCCQTGEQHLIISYARYTFQQTGTGHFSPIGAYLENRDMVLIMDTARFKYPPHWVPLEMLYHSMAEIDYGTLKPRGFLMLKAPDHPDSVCYTFNRRTEWKEAKEFIVSTAPQIFKELGLKGEGVDAVIKEFIKQCPIESVQQFIAIRVSDFHTECGSLVRIQKHFLSEFQNLPLYKLVSQYMDPVWAADEHCIGRITLLLLLNNAAQWLGDVENEALRDELGKLLDLSDWSLVSTEVSFVHHQWNNLIAFGELSDEEDPCANGMCYRTSQDGKF